MRLLRQLSSTDGVGQSFPRWKPRLLVDFLPGVFHPVLVLDSKPVVGNGDTWSGKVAAEEVSAAARQVPAHLGPLMPASSLALIGAPS